MRRKLQIVFGIIFSIGAIPVLLIELWASNRGGRRGEYEGFPNLDQKNSVQEHIELPVVVQSLQLQKQQRVLEVGTGRGIALPGLYQRLNPKKLVGLDIDQNLLIEAKRNIISANLTSINHQIDLVQGDVRNLPFGNHSFDIIIDFGTLYHISNPQLALHEISRVLVPGGIFVEETELAQFISHPVRSWGRTIPWSDRSCLELSKWRLLYQTRTNLC